jgi:hypothetical protein
MYKNLFGADIVNMKQIRDAGKRYYNYCLNNEIIQREKELYDYRKIEKINCTIPNFDVCQFDMEKYVVKKS